MISVRTDTFKDIPPLPLSTVRLAALVSDLNSTIDDFTKVIEYDPVLTGNTLRWANSAWSQPGTPILNIRTAIIRLGAANVLKMAVGHHLQPALSTACQNYGLEENELWRHSVAAALAAEQLTKFSLLTIPPGTFAAALMHDIGKLILGRHQEYHKAQATILELIREEQVSYVTAERIVTGTDHAEVGGQLAEVWKLPESLVTTIAGHHDPEHLSNTMRDAVHIANAVARLTGQGLGYEAMNLDASSESARRLGITPLTLQAICAETSIELETMERNWSFA